MHPEKVDGLGEQAYWVPGPMGGLLYILRNDRLLRISVGGLGTSSDKRKKSEALARKALTRL